MKLLLMKPWLQKQVTQQTMKLILPLVGEVIQSLHPNTSDVIAQLRAINYTL